MGPDDVVVTGIGMVTPLGADAPSTVRAWREGRSAARRRLCEFAGTPLESAEAAVPPELDAAARLGSRRMLKYMSGPAVLGCVAAHEAALDAEMSGRYEPERIGLYSATGLASTSVGEVIPMMQRSIDDAGRFSCRLLGERGLKSTNPLLSFRILANMPACLVSILEQVRGPNLIFTPWEGQAAAALSEARAAVASGEVDCALAGSSDDAANPATFVYLRRTGALRGKEFPAAAAAYIVLERAGAAARDGRRAYARVREMGLAAVDAPAHDPIAARMGRTFAAAPSLQTALACACGPAEVRSVGFDRHEFRALLGDAA